MRLGSVMAILALFAFLLCGSLSGNASAEAPLGRPWLGIAMESELASGGVRVTHVTRGSPAERAGIREGDRVVRVATVRVDRGIDIIRAIGSHAVGDTVDLTFLRGTAGEQHVRVTLAPFPSQDDMARMDLVGAFAPPWKDLQAVSGTFPSSVGGLRGRVVLLDFWATWCGPCRIIMPKLAALQAKYGAQGLSVLGVSTESTEKVALFAQQAALPYAIAVDERGETTRGYGVESLPTLVVVDKRGVVRDVAIGYDTDEDLHIETMVRTLLAEPAPNP
jgi:thiol-disulfide isomerase/thioredoxin